MLVLSTMAAVFGAPFVDERYVYYDLKGDTAKSLLRQIKAERGANGFHARTKWFVIWHYRRESASDECLITDVQIEVDIEYLMPRWLDRGKSHNEHLVDIWDRYEQALQLHEHGHGDIAIDAGREVEAALLQMLPRHDCDQLSSDADTLAKKIIDQHHRRDLLYDRITSHGATQGATFP